LCAYNILGLRISAELKTIITLNDFTVQKYTLKLGKQNIDEWLSAYESVVETSKAEWLRLREILHMAGEWEFFRRTSK
jgi:hypothetical protein